MLLAVNTHRLLGYACAFLVGEEKILYISGWQPLLTMVQNNPTRVRGGQALGPHPLLLGMGHTTKAPCTKP